MISNRSDFILENPYQLYAASANMEWKCFLLLTYAQHVYTAK